VHKAPFFYLGKRKKTGLQFAKRRYNVYTLLYIISDFRKMDLQIAKWGNSLALRIPADYVRSIGIKEGDHVQASLTMDGGISIRAAKWDRKAFANELHKVRESTTMGESVVEELRRGARY